MVRYSFSLLFILVLHAVSTVTVSGILMMRDGGAVGKAKLLKQAFGSAMVTTKKVLGNTPLLLSTTAPFRLYTYFKGNQVPIAHPSEQVKVVDNDGYRQYFGEETPTLDSTLMNGGLSNFPHRQHAASSPKEALFGSQFVRNAVNKVGPSVVRIDCDREVQPLLALFGESAPDSGETIKVSGTGFVASADGHVLTNSHVVENARRITVTLSNGRMCRAKVVANDEFTDLAVIKAEVTKEKGFDYISAPLGDSSVLHAGDWVIAVGCPVGLDFTVTLGVVSSPKRSAVEVGASHLRGSYIQTDAALNSGNSGGPLVNAAGQVVGINTMVRSNTEAIGFAIPINRAMQIYDVLKQGNKPTHAHFGVELQSVTPDSARIHNDDPNAHRLPEVFGARVVKVASNSPAAACGLRKNDIIVAVNNREIFNSDDADIHMDSCKPGRPAVLRVARGESGNKIDLTANPVDLLAMMNAQRRMHPPVVVIKPSEFDSFMNGKYKRGSSF